MLLTLTWGVISPTVSFALTSGPSQPEMQSFEPVGTTDMVNSFTGDFVYNIPLLDVEGYPINIAYHSGITAEEEASWVGLGWNINPGNISRAVRGIPDDFDGEKIEKEIVINPEVKKRFGMFFGLEVAGVGLSKEAKKIAQTLKINVGGNLSMGVDISNYTGVSASFGIGTDMSVKQGWMSAGINMGATFTTDNGVDLNGSANAGYSSSAKGMTSAINGSFGKGYNSREGLKYTSFGVNPSFAYNKGWNQPEGHDRQGSANGRPEGVSNTMVPISMQNFVPVITNANFMESSYFQFKVGIEAGATVYPDFGGSFGRDEVNFQQDGSRRAYGYLNLQHASKDDITDFTRDRDGNVNRDKQYLPPGSMTYDVYAVNGQGTAGNFRAFRADVGTVYDPYTNSDNRADNDVVEIGAGNIFEAGWDHVSSFTSSSSGPWNQYKNGFSSRKPGSVYEPHYFKQAGELSGASQEFLSAIKGNRPLSVTEAGALDASPLENSFNAPYDNQKRSPRANLLYYFTAEEASNPAVSLMPKIQDYQTPGSLDSQLISRIGGPRKAHQASEFTQLLPDGRRYIYGIPAMNNTQTEYVMSALGTPASDGTASLATVGATDKNPYGGLVAGDATFGQKFFMKSTTPSYAHSYLLSSILSADYSDLTGDGISDDDLGNYTKFNYSRKESDYQWRTPYAAGRAQYDEGVLSDCHDDKATFVIGSKEIWMLHSIETKNYLAEFYTSQRLDGLASTDPLLSTTSTGHSYKLDSIILFNRKERILSGHAAVPIKKVVFSYDYSLCKGISNVASGSPNTGKLTLKAISIKSGASDMGYLSPYRFVYSQVNPGYGAGDKDMWGSYKAATANLPSTLNNHQFPYVIQDSTQATQNANAWNLTDIKLPSGGAIHVTYEPDDYAYVQNRRAMEMFSVTGIGPDANFKPGANSLYQSETNPYLYVYFLRKQNGSGTVDEWVNDMKKAYLDNGDLIQYNFRVKMSSKDERTASCGIPMEDHIKGYAAVDAIGVCAGNQDYGYVKLAPKTVDKMPALKKLNVSNLSLNPVTLSAIFYAKYYNSKALYPSSEIVSADAETVIKQLISSFAEISDYFRSPIAKYLNDGRAKYVDLNQSYVRLCSQGKKFGGGHRVKRIEFKDNWDQVSASTQPNASYGSEYDYTMVDEATGKHISSGVASYEPLFGGDENPFKEPVATDRIGQQSDFPSVIPTELTVEGPIGESMYPSASVGYSKVTVTSIHKSEGASSQTVLEHEFYTAKDFPVRTANTALEKLQDDQLKPLDFSPDKKDIYRVGQGYSLYFNDMHGKQKKESVWVNQGDEKQLVSYKKYEYFTNTDGTLNNRVSCIGHTAFDRLTTYPDYPLGVETDIMLDSREKKEETHTTGFMANLNVFMVGPLPIPIPTAFPKIPKSVEKTFSSLVTTKITQQYGILKSVETFDKGATVKLTNEVFDANTGQALITNVNTEHIDYEAQHKTPAYWAYRCMGPAYKNILYEDNLNTGNASIVADTFYFKTSLYNRYNLGDELLLKVNKSCSLGTNDVPQSYRLYVVNKPGATPSTTSTPQCKCIIPTNAPAINYTLHYDCDKYVYPHNYIAYDNYGSGYKFQLTGVDNVCNIPHDTIFLHEDFGAEGINGENKLLDLLSPNQPAKVFPELNDILFTVGKRYPLEAVNFSFVDHNDSEYNSGACDCWDSGNPFIPAGPQLNGVNLTDPLYFHSCEPPWHHGGLQAGASSFIRGTVTDSIKYKVLYPKCPKLWETNQILKLTIRIGNVMDLYAYEPSRNDSVLFANFCDYKNPYDLQHNKFSRGTYTLYFPYDPAYVKSKGISLSQLTKSNVLFWSGVNHTTLNYGILNWSFSTTPPIKLPQAYFPYSPISANNKTYSAIHMLDKWYFSSQAQIIPRRSINGYDQANSVAALPIKRHALSATGNPAKAFPSDDLINEGSIKVIRSGKRNQLQETIEDETALYKNPGYYYFPASPTNQYGQALSIAANTFTDTAAASETIADYAKTDYYNPYVTGMRGNYRLAAKYNINLKRDYSAATDPYRGIISIVRSFWRADPSLGWTHDHYLELQPDDTSTIWTKSVEVSKYSPWGNDIEVKDAAGNKQATIFGYGNSLPVASVKNSEWDNSLYENFEDYGIQSNILNFYQNTLNSFLRKNTTPVSFTTASYHTGAYALQIASATSTTIPICGVIPATFPVGGLYPFHFRPGKKYIVSYWQKATQNTANLSAAGLLSLTIGGVTQSIYAKTPVIDGWVMYEKEISIPANATPASISYATVSLAAGVIDDIRMLPVEANMKCYVYNPTNRKLAAVLDENHMASYFEYDAEGKLIRVKKETEKGILTLKESRASVHNVISSGSSSTIDLKN